MDIDAMIQNTLSVEDSESEVDDELNMRAEFIDRYFNNEKEQENESKSGLVSPFQSVFLMDELAEIYEVDCGQETLLSQ